MKRILVIGLCLISLSLVACGNNKVNEDVSKNTEVSEESKEASNELFLSLASEAINESLEEIISMRNEGTMTNESYANIIERENEKIELLLGNIYDEDLLRVAKDYVEGNKLNIKYNREDEEKGDPLERIEYGWERDKLIATSVVELVENYGLVINEENKAFYNNCRKKFDEINKDNENIKIAQDLLSNIEFEAVSDESWSEGVEEDWFKYTATIKNTSDVSFRSIDVTLKLVDKDGTSEEGKNIIWEFYKGTEQDFYFYSPKEYESISIIVDRIITF